MYFASGDSRYSGTLPPSFPADPAIGAPTPRLCHHLLSSTFHLSYLSPSPWTPRRHYHLWQSRYPPPPLPSSPSLEPLSWYPTLPPSSPRSYTRKRGPVLFLRERVYMCVGDLFTVLPLHVSRSKTIVFFLSLSLSLSLSLQRAWRNTHGVVEYI